MNGNKSPFEYAFTLVGAVVVAIIGAIVGGTIYISTSGAIVGALISLALLALLAIVLTALGLQGKAKSEDTKPATPANQEAAGATSTTTVEATPPSEAPIVEEKIEATESEARLLAAGRFAEYHLAKAKRLQQAGRLKEAAHQADASLAHAKLPETQTLREQIRKAAGR